MFTMYQVNYKKFIRSTLACNLYFGLYIVPYILELVLLFGITNEIGSLSVAIICTILICSLSLYGGFVYSREMYPCQNNSTPLGCNSLFRYDPFDLSRSFSAHHIIIALPIWNLFHVIYCIIWKYSTCYVLSIGFPFLLYIYGMLVGIAYNNALEGEGTELENRYEKVETEETIEI